MIEQIMSMKTNELIVAFVLNNIVLLELIRRTLKYVCKKTPWALDDDLPSFFGGLLTTASNFRKGARKENEEIP